MNTVKEATTLGYTFTHAATFRGGRRAWDTWLIGPLGTREQYVECPHDTNRRERERRAVEAFAWKMAAYERLLSRAE